MQTMQTTAHLFDFMNNPERAKETLRFEHFNVPMLRDFPNYKTLEGMDMDLFLETFVTENREEIEDYSEKWKRVCLALIRDFHLVSSLGPHPNSAYVLEQTAVHVRVDPVIGLECEWIQQWVANQGRRAPGSLRHLELIKAFHIRRLDPKKYHTAIQLPKSPHLRLGLHATRCTNFFPILREGLQLCPPEVSNAGSGYADPVYGKGLYFAECLSYCTRYCADEDGITPTGQRLLVFVAVMELGPSPRICVGLNAAENLREWGPEETARKVIGRNVPDPNSEMNVHLDGRDIKVNPGPMVYSNRDPATGLIPFILRRPQDAEIRFALIVQFKDD